MAKLLSISQIKEWISIIPLEETRGRIAQIIGVIFCLFTLYVLTIRPIDPLLIRSTFVFLSIFMAILLRPISDKKMFVVLDLIIIILNTLVWVYTIVNYQGLIQRAGVLPTDADVIVGFILFLSVIELARRTMGLPLPILGIFLFLYGLYGNYFPGLFRHPGFSFERLTSYIFSLDGIFGVPLAVTVTYVFIFVMFGAFMDAVGGGEAIKDLAMSIAGRSRGGAAKMAVLASSLFGSIHGSPVANVTATGSFTIPLMKRTGINPVFAGAAEAAASCGGQILPPVMGASVFIMIEVLGVPYAHIAIPAILPALLYYAAVFWMVELRARKLNLKGLPPEEIPKFLEILKAKIHVLTPILVLIFTLLVLQLSPLRAGLYGIASCIILSFLRKETRLKTSDFIEALYTTAKNTLLVTAAVTVAGGVIAVVGLSGLGLRMTTILLSYSAGTLILTLIFGMIALIILGIGMPTTGSYVIGAVLIAPAIIELGIPPLAAHLFVLYFANFSNITPPVAMAAYAASGIAQAQPIKIAIQAFQLGILGFMIPYVFVYNPALILQGSITQIVITFLTAAIGVFSLGIAIQGVLWKQLHYYYRIILFAIGLTLIFPIKIWFSLPIIGLLALVLFFIKSSDNKNLKEVVM